MVVLGLLLLGGLGLGAMNVGEWLDVNQRPIPSEAIIILGGGPPARVTTGVSLYRHGFGHWIILTGGDPTGAPCTEAEEMAREALREGVPASRLVLDNRALTTYQNAVDSWDIMRRHHWRSALVVSSNFHMRRVSIVFSLVYRHSPIRLRFIASPDSAFHPRHWWTSLEGWRLVVTELLLIPVNAVQGYLTPLSRHEKREQIR
ncbi:MAG: YdcF family protein [Firmicutes bacterium]|nr:YdcF family protein [Bacillota bacterium]